MFSNYPGSSPSSYKSDASFLQRATQQGLDTLTVPGPSTFSPTSSNSTEEEEDVRGRRKIRKVGKRLSTSSAYSIGGTRLTPTEEVDSASEADQDEDLEGEEEEEEVDEYEGPPKIASNHRPTVTILTENTPLLGNNLPISPNNYHQYSSSPTSVSNKPLQKSNSHEAARQELSILLSYTLPICGTHFLEYSLLVINVISLGHLGTVELAASSIASMTANVVALSVIQGFCTALDTLCPQAYTSKPKDTSLHALRTAVLLVGLLIPQVILFWNGEGILLLLRQDPRVAERAGVYLKVLSFGLPGYAGFECVRRWLQAQGLMLAPVITLMIAAPVNVILNYLLVWGPDSIRIGFVGAPLATAVSMNCMFLVSVLYSVYFAPHDAWSGFSWEIFHGLGINIRLGLAGTAMCASEWWCWEIVGLASSYFGAEVLAAQSILLTSASLFYQIPYSLSVAGAVRVGNLLGGQRPKLARTTSRVAMGIAVAIASLNSLLLIIFKDSWGRLFSSEDEVIKIVASVLPLVALFQLTDSLSGATGGLLRGAGRAPLGALINLTSYYIIGLPIGFYLAFGAPKLELLGLWCGLTIALSFTAVITVVLVYKLDWEAESERARIRMGLSKIDGEEEV